MKPHLVSSKKTKWTVDQQANVVNNLAKKLERQIRKLKSMQEGHSAEVASEKADKASFFVGQHVTVNEQEFTVSRLMPGTMLLEEVRQEKGV